MDNSIKTPSDLGFCCPHLPNFRYGQGMAGMARVPGCCIVHRAGEMYSSGGKREAPSGERVLGASASGVVGLTAIIVG